MTTILDKGFGSAKGMSKAFFDKCFGDVGIKDEQLYLDPMRKGLPGSLGGLRGIQKNLGVIGKSHYDNMKKTASIGINTGGTFTGYGLMPPFVDPEVVDTAMKDTPLSMLLRRRAVRGRSYVYNKVTARRTASFQPSGSPQTVSADTRSTVNALMKYLYVAGLVEGPALASGEGFIDLLSEDVRSATLAMLEALENEIVNGDTSTNANGFDGLRTTITTNSTSNSTNPITLELMRTDMATARSNRARTDLIVTDPETFAYIKNLLMDFQRVGEPRDRMDFGIPGSFMFDKALVIDSLFMPTTSNQHEILYLDTRFIELAVLQDISFKPLADNSDADKFMLKWYGTLVVKHEPGMVQRTAIQ